MISKKFLTTFMAFCCLSCVAFGDEEQNSLATQIQITKEACSGISDKMSGMKTMAGINTAVTGVGTVTGGAALGTGIAKADTDQQIENWETILDEMIKINGPQTENFTTIRILSEEELEEELNGLYEYTGDRKRARSYVSNIKTATEKSKTLGKIRTGTMAASAVADTAGTIIALNNRIDQDLQDQIDDCIAAVDTLNNERFRARAENSATEDELDTADQIIDACSSWRNVDLSSVDKRAMGAAVSGGTGAALAIAGTITSAKANSDEVRNQNDEAGKAKEKNLNTTSNVLAGGATVASAAATVFNATQISAIKKAVSAADKCEEALK